MKEETESQKVWHYRLHSNETYLGTEPLVIARTAQEAKDKIKNKKGAYPLELWWKTLYNPKETTYPKGTIY